MRLRPRIAALLTLLAAIGLAGPAAAITTENSWSVSSTVAPGETGETDTTINVTECREQVSDALDGNSNEDVTFNITTGTPNTGARYSVKLAIGDEPCDETVLEEVGEDTCLTIIEDEELLATPISLDFTWEELSPAKTLEGCEGLEQTTQVYLIVYDPDFTSVDPDPYTVSFDINFDTVRPAAPTDLEIVAGGTSLEVSWTEATTADSFRIYADTDALTAGAIPEEVEARTSVANGSPGRIASLAENTEYHVAVTAIDDVGNESLLSQVTVITTSASTDFWEDYNSDGSVDGGFCFIATAAYGSYQEPHVQVLRDFRDRFLLTNAPGSAFVDAYYANSPPVAAAIADSEALRALTRAALAPLYAVAIILLYGGALAPFALLVAFLLSAWLMLRVARRFVRRVGARWRARAQQAPAASASPVTRWRRALLFGATAGLLVAIAAPASAQNSDRGIYESPVDMLLEFKGGPYLPSELGGIYTTYFGEESAILIEAEFDYQVWRGWIGSLGVGGHLGFASVEGNAIDANTGEPSVDTTSLNWLPLRLSFVARLDLFKNLWDVPIVLYGKAGLDYYIWWVNDASGDTATSADGTSGSGGTFGWHVALGGAFLLDWLSPRMAAGFDAEWGVNNSYIFAEFLLATIDNFGADGAFNLSDTGTFQIGLAIEF